MAWSLGPWLCCPPRVTLRKEGMDKMISSGAGIRDFLVRPSGMKNKTCQGCNLGHPPMKKGWGKSGRKWLPRNQEGKRWAVTVAEEKRVARTGKEA